MQVSAWMNEDHVPQRVEARAPSLPLPPPPRPNIKDAVSRKRENKRPEIIEHATEQREKTDETPVKNDTDMSDDQRRKHQEMPQHQRRSFRR